MARRINSRWDLEEVRKEKKQQAIQAILDDINSGGSYKGNKVTQTVTPQKTGGRSASTKTSSKSSSGSSSRSSAKSAKKSPSGRTSGGFSSSTDTRPAGARIPEFLQGPRTAQPRVQPILTRASTRELFKSLPTSRSSGGFSGGSVGSALPRAAGTTRSERASDLNQLMSNSVAWHFSNDAEKERLYQANNAIRQKYGLQYKGGDTFYPNGVNLSEAQNLMGQVAKQKGYNDQNVLTTIGHNVGAGLAGISQGFYNTVDFLLPDVITPEAAQNYIDKAKTDAKSIQERVREYNYTQGGTVGGVAGDLFQSAIGMVPQAVIALMSGGASTAGQLGSQASTALGTVRNAITNNAGYLSSFLSTVGSDYENAKANGASDTEAALSAILSSAATAGIEVAGGVDVPSQSTSRIRNALRTAFEEGGEEVLQGAVQRGVQATYDPETTVSDVLDMGQMLQDFGGGAILGGIMGGARRPANANTDTPLAGINEDMDAAPRNADAAAPSQRVSEPSGGNYSYRYTNRESPMSDFGHAMFVDNEYSSEMYGREGANRYIVDQNNLRDISDFYDEIAEKISEQYENGTLPLEIDSIIESGTSADDIARSFNPDDIVMSADAWDNGDLTQWFYENIAEPNDVYGFKTNDGAIVFDENMIAREDNPARYLDAQQGQQTDSKSAGRSLEELGEELRAAQSIASPSPAFQADPTRINAQTAGYTPLNIEGALQRLNPASQALRQSVERLQSVYPTQRVQPTLQTAQPSQTAQPRVQPTIQPTQQTAQPRVQPTLQTAAQASMDALRRVASPELEGTTFGANTVGAAQSGYTPKQNVSRVSSNTFRNSRLFNEAEKQSLKIFDEEGDALYDVISERQSLQNAQDRLEADYEGEVKDLPNKPNFSGEDNDTAMGILSRKLEEARKTGNYDDVNEWAKMIKEKGTEAGQFIQSFAKYSRTPEGIVVQGQREIDAAIKYWQKKNPRQLKKLQRKGYLIWTNEDIQKSYDLMQKAEEAGIDTRQGLIYEAQAMRVIADRLPSSNKDKLVTLLMDNMLGNFRTLVARNAGGNALFAIPEGVRQQLIEAPLDAITSLFTKSRTTYFSPIKKTGAWFKGLGKGTADMASDIRHGVHTARSGEQNSVRAQQRTFRNKGLGRLGNLYDAGVGTMLEIGDRPFYEATYAAAMADLQKARDRGRLTKDFEGKDFDTYAPQVARQAALEAVFQNDGLVARGLTKAAEAIGDISRGITGTGALRQSSIPFTKTPGNLTERAIEYSPLGGLKNIIQTGAEVKSGTFDQRRFVRETSRNLVGTLLFIAAGKLVEGGILGGQLSDDKDEKEAQKNAGMQDYAIKIGDNYYSYSWIPVIGPALAGSADFYQILNNTDKNLLDAMWEAAEGYVQSALFEQSALSNLEEMFSGYGGTMDNIGSTLASVSSQLVPSLVRQIAAARDPYERQTYVSGDTLQSQLNYLQSAIPGLREKLPIKRDEQGNEKLASQGRGLASRILENMFLPAKVTADQSNAVRDELMRLKKSTGEVTQFQNKVTYAVERDGQKVSLTPHQSMEYQRIFGQMSTQAIEELMNSGVYDDLSDAQKVKVITEINSYAKTIADSNFADVSLDTAQQKAHDAQEMGIGLGLYYAFTDGMKNIKEANKGSEDGTALNIGDIVDMMESGGFADLTEEQKDFLFDSAGYSIASNPYHISSVERAAQDNAYYQNLTGDDLYYFRSLANEYEDAVQNGKSLDGWVAKAKLAADNGVVEPYQFAELRHALLYADTDENGSYKQEEVTAAINSLSDLTDYQKAYLWQAQNKKWKAESNPFGYAEVYWPETEDTDNSAEAVIDRRTAGMGGSDSVEVQETEEPAQETGINPVAAGPGVSLGDVYGWREAPTEGASTFHQGNDIPAPMGTPVVAYKSGTVSYTGWDSTGGGNMVQIDHPDGTKSVYLHLQNGSFKVNPGQTVSQGQQIANVGSTGTSTGPHLDFRVMVNGKYVDPQPYYPGY